MRYVKDKRFFWKLVKVARMLPEANVLLGGNAATMANRLAYEGCDVLLGGTMSDHMKDELHSQVEVVGGVSKYGDVHLILEYKAGERWGKYTTPRANRFILHSDECNPVLGSMESFRSRLPIFRPHLIAIGGLQMMDNFPSTKRKDKIISLSKMLQSVPSWTKIHFELASFTEEDLMDCVIENVLPYADSIGLNEQELTNLYTLLNYGDITLVADPCPKIATVLDQMRMIYTFLHKTPRINGKRPITRIHTHTLAYQAIITSKDSGWKNSMAAAAKASLTAFRHVSGSSEVDTGKAKLLMDDSFSISSQEGSKMMPLNADRPVSCWEEDDYEICVAPTLVCTEVIRTAGAGDNISAAALAVQL